jgi:carotenoid cleavage dioxygenase-like enzyme
MQEQKIVHKVELGHHQSCGEVIFCPKDNAKEEDDGYLGLFIFKGAEADKEPHSNFELRDA